MISLHCTATALCDFHRDGGPASDKCPYFCDADGCDQEAVVEPHGDGKSYCRQHAATEVSAAT